MTRQLATSAYRGEAVQHGNTDLKLRDLTVEVPRAGQEVAGSVHVILHHQGTRAQFAQDRTKEIEDCPFVLDLKFFMTAGEVSDCPGAPALLGHMPKAEWLLADQGYGADWCREALKDRGDTGVHPGPEEPKKKLRFDRRRYKRRNRFEIMFGRLKDWRRIPHRYDRCPEVFLSAVALAATVLFWLREFMSLAHRRDRSSLVIAFRKRDSGFCAKPRQRPACQQCGFLPNPGQKDDG